MDGGRVECDGSGALREPPASHGSGASTEDTTSHGSGSPSMPHLDLTQEELDRLYPSLIPPDDEQLDDLANDKHDVVYQKGLQLAEAIRDETSLQGRMRRPLLAELQEQQRHDRSSKQDRTSTIRPFGGGVLTEASTSTTATTLGTATTTLPRLTTLPAPTTSDGQMDRSSLITQMKMCSSGSMSLVMEQMQSLSNPLLFAQTSAQSFERDLSRSD